MADELSSGAPTKLPRAEHALVTEAKVCEYLLSFSHPIGRFKAVFFAALGYKIERWQRLQSDLLQLAASGVATAGRKSSYGQKYEIRGTLVTPSGRRASLVTVWIVLHGESYPQLVTAYPGEQK